MKILNDQTINILSKSMDVATLRHQTIINNIANVNTKDYKASYVSFEEEFKKAIENSTDEQAIDEVQPKVIKDNTTSMRQDGNNVDIDSEMANLAANQLLYDSLVQRVSGKISTLRYVISEGKR